MKVFQVLRRFNLQTWGGIETVVLSLATAMEKRGMVSPVLCTSALDAPGPERIGNVSIHRYRYSYLRVPPQAAVVAALDQKGGNPVCPGLFRRILNEPALDIVSCHTMGRLGAQVRTACLLRKVPYVVTLHGGYYAVPPDEKRRLRAQSGHTIDGGKWLDPLLGQRRYLADAGAIFCLAADEFEKAQQENPNVMVRLVPNGVDVARFANINPHERSQFRQEYGILQNARLILCVARIDPQKGQDRLIDAIAMLLGAGLTDTHLAFAGPVTDAEYAASLRAKVYNNGLENHVHWLGAFPFQGSQLERAYAASDVVALASRHEPFGVAILEAWAAKVPVVASRVGGIPSFVTNGKTGLLVPDGDSVMLAAHLRRILTDQQLRESLAQQAFSEVTQKYDWSKITDGIVKVYEEVCDQYRR
ncbi:MAG: glycosyltransferase family 4 protein [Myxococcales bacterium]|nr:glycosyltransferase family 4 protein [Myxococcales bacterium]